jgi:hypothetical protein
MSVLPEWQMITDYSGELTRAEKATRSFRDYEKDFIISNKCQKIIQV